jgi:hypothetical protein
MNYEKLYAYVADRAARGLIDSVGNLTQTPLYLYSGINDSIVYQAEMKATEVFFAKYISRAKTQSVWNINSEHGYITDNFGGGCAAPGPPPSSPKQWLQTYFHNCNYDQAGAILAQIYGELKPKATSAPPANLKRIVQKRYTPPNMTWVWRKCGYGG